MSQPSWPGEADTPLVRRCVHDLLEDAAARFPEHDALVSVTQGERLTFAGLWCAARQTAQALRRHGIGQGDRVGIWSANRIEWVVVQFAVSQIGAILVTVNTAYREEELAYVVGHAGCNALFFSPRFRTFDCLDAAVNVKALHPQLALLVHFDDVDAPGESTSWHRFLDDRTEGPNDLAPELAVTISPDDPVSIQYTSGTTGRPKGVTLSHFNLVNNGIHVGGRLGLSPLDRVCLPVPLFHCFGMVIGVIGACAYASTIVLPDQSFDAHQCMVAIGQERCTAFYGVPMMFIAMLNAPGFEPGRFASLRTGLMGGAPCPAETLRAAMERLHMPELSVVYGMTETSPISVQTQARDPLDIRVGTVGRPHPHVQIKIADLVTGRALPPGERGEYCVRGYLVMSGYWNDLAATRSAIDEEGWLHSGDIAVLRHDGAVEIVGRVKDMLIRGGENIFPREIEDFLYRLPEIADVHVFGLPDPVYGEQVCAWIRLKDGCFLDEDGVRAACKGKIAGFKIPYYLRFVSEFPTTASGKVQKFRMRQIEIDERHLLDMKFSVEPERSAR